MRAEVSIESGAIIPPIGMSKSHRVIQWALVPLFFLLAVALYTSLGNRNEGVFMAKATPAKAILPVLRPDARCTSVDVPQSVEAGKTFPMTFVVQNAGKQLWVPGQQFLTMGCSLWGTVAMTRLTRPVVPEMQQVFTLKARAPAIAGTYPVFAQMADQRASFGQPCQAIVQVVAAGSQSSASSSQSSSAAGTAIQKLEIVVKATTVSDTVVENAKNVSLLRLEAKAQENDLLFTGTIFDAESGSLLNGTNYALWVDTNDDRSVDTVLQSGVLAQEGKVTFRNLKGGGAVLPRGKSIVFEVHGDVASSLVGDDLRLRLATSVPQYVAAEMLSDGRDLAGIKTNGTCVGTCEISVTTAPSVSYTIRPQGDLYVTLDSQLIGPRQLLGGVLSDPILRIKLHAEYEDIDVTDLVLNSSGGTAGSVDSLELWLEGATGPIVVSGGCGGSADVLAVNRGATNTLTSAFCFAMESGQLLVRKGMDVKVHVRPRMKTDVNGAVSGDVVALFIDHTAASNDATGTGSVRARGVNSSNNLLANNGNKLPEGEVFIGRASPAPANARVVGSYNVTVLSKIVGCTFGSSNLCGIVNGGRETGTVPSGAEREIGAFTFTAAHNTNGKNGTNHAEVRDIIFTVSGINVEMDAGGFKLHNRAASMSQNISCIPLTANGQVMTGKVTGTFFVDCPNPSSAVNTSIDSGQSLTLVLLANVTNPNTAASIGGSSILQISLDRFTHPAATGTSHLTWLDADSAGAVSFSWVEYPDTVVNSTLYRG